MNYAIKKAQDLPYYGMGSQRYLSDDTCYADSVGVLTRGTAKTQIKRGIVLATAGTITPHDKFEATVFILTKEEGGRHSSFITGYRPQFYVRTTDVTGKIIAFRAEDTQFAEFKIFC